MSNLPLAIIADVHANTWALEAVLEDIRRRGIQQIVNLGDCLYGPLDPAGTARLLMDLNILTIRGNQDRILVTQPTDPTPTFRFVQKHLTRESIDWLKKLPVTATLSDEFFLCHGDPHSDEVYLLEGVVPGGIVLKNSREITASVADVKEPVILCAHTHIPRTVFLPNGKLIINPGSVGMPAYTDDSPLPHAMESGSPHAKYALLTREDGRWQVEHVLIPYAWEAAASVARENHANNWARWLSTGRA